MPIGSIGLGFLAGVFSTLSPCVLPLLPLVIGPALAAHRFGLAALLLGLISSFVAVGMFVATVGFALGVSGDVFRLASAGVLAALGVVLLSAGAGQRFAFATGRIGNAANRAIARLSPEGLGGQFTLGVLLGGVWSPCVGPTLGAASMLAAQGRDIGAVAAVMVAFGVGTAVPLLLVGLLSREVLARWRGRLMSAGASGKLDWASRRWPWPA